MGATTLATLADVINEQAEQTLRVLKDNVDARRASGLGVLSEFIRMAPAPAGDKVRWSVLTTGGTADSFDLATGTYQAAQNQSYDEAELDYKGIHTTFRLMQHALNAVRGGILRGIGDLVAHNVEEAVRDIMLEVEVQRAGAGAGNDIAGIQSVIQVAAPFAGIDPGTATYWQPLIDSVSAAWSEDKMEAFLESYRAPGRNGTGRVALTGYQQFHKIGRVLKESNPVQYVATSDVVAGTTGIRFEAIGIYPVAGYANTRLDLIDPADWNLVVLQNMTTIELGRTGHYREFAITLEANTRCRSPRNTGAMTALT